MAGTFGGISCTLVKGAQAAPRERVQSWQQPGVDGVGAITLGLGSGEFEFALVLHDTKAKCELWKADLEATQGTIVTALDDLGIPHENLLVEEVSPPDRRVAFVPPSSNLYRYEIRVRGKVTE